MKEVYLVRRMSRETPIYEVTKWVDDKEPCGIYDVDMEGKPSCNCPGFTMHPSQREHPGAHKHIRIVREFQLRGEQWGTVFFFDSQGSVRSTSMGVEQEALIGFCKRHLGITPSED